MDELRVSTGCGADALMTELGVMEIMGRCAATAATFRPRDQTPTK
jgi:hypothetical protein